MFLNGRQFLMLESGGERSQQLHELRRLDRDASTSTIDQTEGASHHQHPIDVVHGKSGPETTGEGKIPVFLVLTMTVAMAGAAGIGALPFFFVRSLSPKWGSIATAIACGVMFAASFDLIHEGQPYGSSFVVLGVVLGAVAIRAVQHWLDGMENVSFGHLKGIKARRMMLMIGIMAAHAVGEGCGVGVSFCGEQGWSQGVLTTLAIGTHNVPEGLAKATVLVGQGASATEALFWSIATCLPQPLVAIPSFLFVEAFRSLMPIALGFAAGCMIWMVFAELLPDALKGIEASQVASAATLSAAALEGIRMGFESLHIGEEYNMDHAGASPNRGDFATNSGDATRLHPVFHITASNASAAISSLRLTSDSFSLLKIFAVFLPAIAASAGGGILSSVKLPPALVVGFGSGLTAVCGALPILSQLWSNQDIPVIHILSTAVGGATLTALLYRHLQMYMVSVYDDKRDDDDMIPESDIENVHNGVDVNQCDKHDAATSKNPNFQKIASRFSWPFSRPISYGAKAQEHGTKYDRSLVSSTSGNRRLSSTEFQHVSIPISCAGMFVFGALLLQALSLGWQFARYVILRESMSAANNSGGRNWEFDLSMMLVIAVALRALAMGIAVRAIIGRLKGIRMCLLSSLMVPIVTMTVIDMLLFWLPVVDSTKDLGALLTYPHGLTDSISVFIGGALVTASYRQFTAAMYLKPRHGRVGALASVTFVICTGLLLWSSCHMFSTSLACQAF